MAIWQGKAKRSKTGRKIRYARNKKKFEIGRESPPATIGKPRNKVIRTRGNNKKVRITSTNIVYVTDLKTKKTTKTEIIKVIENPTNIHYVRRSIINKGAIIETKLGKAKITSRPGQSGNLNAVLLSS